MASSENPVMRWLCWWTWQWMSERFRATPLSPAFTSTFTRAVALAGALSLACVHAQAAASSDWFDGSHASPLAFQAVGILAGAAGHGLEPADYDAAQLSEALERLTGERAPAPAQIVHIDQALDAAMTRFLSDLHFGRIDPRKIHHDFTPPARADFDASAVLRDALAAHDLNIAVRRAAPNLPLYWHLMEALARYRSLAADPAWGTPLPPLPGPASRSGATGKLEPGQAYAGLPALAQRLESVGDLAPDAQAVSRYEGPLVEAVRMFQRRHGLSDDGVIGRATFAQLQVTPAQRARQIELTMERLRWTPLFEGRRMIVINVPEFVLRAYEVRDGHIRVHEQMKVIVGKALDTRTPLFDEDMRFIEFSPYWNIPPSIARKETVPRLRRDPGYWAREGLEFVGPGGIVDTALSASRLDGVLAGPWRMRQRPGPRNALGDIKFVFPNSDNIYLHHTPATELFARDRRDFSHGCIRVENPVALAQFVLQGMPQWTESRIREAMTAGHSSTLALAEPVPTLIAYGTTLVKGGRIFFYDDIYGYDRLLDQALRQREHQPHPTP